MTRAIVLVVIALTGLTALVIAKQIVRYDERCQSGDAFSIVPRAKRADVKV